MPSSRSQDAAVWRITPGQALRFHEWQGEYVLYNDISGDTHLFGPDPIDLLLTLQAAPLAQSALPAHLSAADEPSDDAGPSLLAQLQALALIEPVA